ncbi:kinase-like domain-containing protein [Jimgerdemannia flammicorona]|uniref:non-specific serine/threonine protein kinase n=1 Tax=Jimgerdemannia flammicorona TaxID=994334 RepID=A0A433PEH1_9FUNG|nr:kinase-like domain-containing protein [Jimgerdemannia flammicorona]
MANIPADANPLRDTSFLPSTDNSEKAHFSALYDIPCLPKGSVKQGDAIGQGAFGCIYRGTYNNTTVAIKHINMGHVDTKGVDKMVQNELKLLYRLRESNFVIPLIGYYRHTEFRVWIVMEYAENGDLAKYLRKGYLKGKWLAKVCHVAKHPFVFKSVVRPDILFPTHYS